MLDELRYIKKKSYNSGKPDPAMSAYVSGLGRVRLTPKEKGCKWPPCLMSVSHVYEGRQSNR
jgi:hypothetical protein